MKITMDGVVRTPQRMKTTTRSSAPTATIIIITLLAVLTLRWRYGVCVCEMTTITIITYKINNDDDGNNNGDDDNGYDDKKSCRLFRTVRRQRWVLFMVSLFNYATGFVTDSATSAAVKHCVLFHSFILINLCMIERTNEHSCNTREA